MVSKLSKWFSTIFDRIVDTLASLAGVLLIALMLLICYEVVMRYFFARPPAWAIEISEAMLLYITFLGTAWLLKVGGHVAVDIVYAQLNPKVKLSLDVITSAMGLVICLILTWYSGASAWDHFLRGARLTQALDYPKVILLAIIPAGFLTLSAQFLRQTRQYFGQWKDTRQKGIAAVKEQQ